MSASANIAAEAPKDLDRILQLPQRPPLDCERERGVRRWAPEAQALIDVETAKYAVKRLVCGCRDRYVSLHAGGDLTVYQQPPPSAPPPPPVLTSREAFLRDNAYNLDTVKAVRDLRPGESVTLPGLGHAFCLTEFNPAQAWSLRELPKTRGLLGFLSVGSGKTAMGLMAPMSVPDCRTVILLAKPNQRLHYRDHYLRLREHFKVPGLQLDKAGIKGSYIVPGAPTIHFVPYSMLSSTNATLLLDERNPDMVIGDEVHLLSNRDAARTLRFMRLMARRNGVVFCAWSGSLINKSVRDVAHLSTHALGLGSPYPILPDVVDQWSSVIDPVYAPDYVSDTAKKLRMAFGRSRNVERQLFSDLISDGGIREGHRDRVIATPGVVSTRSSSVNCSLAFFERKLGGDVPGGVLDALSGVRNEAVRPDGEELVEALQITETAREVAAGFYSYWAFPKHVCACQPGVDRRCPSCQLILDWFAARKEFYKKLRVKVRRGEPHLDSKKLCENAAERAWQEPRYQGELPVWPEESWPPWCAIKDRVPHDSKYKWIDDFLARDAAAWAQEHRGVVWCHSRPFGKRVAQILGVHYHDGGVKGEELLRAEKGDRSLVISLTAFGESFDGLQHLFHEQLVAEPPASGKAWEQLLGRLAREGQQADTVSTWVYRHLEEFRHAFRQAIRYAEFIEATTPNRQLLLSADMEFEP